MIKTSSGSTVTAEVNSFSPTIELVTGAVMNVDNTGATINTLILNGGTFNAPTGTMNFYAQGNSPLQYNGGTFNTNSGTVQFIGRQCTIATKLPLELYNVNISMIPPHRFVVNNTDGDLNINGTLTLIDGNLGTASAVNVMNAKDNVLVKSTFDG